MKLPGARSIRQKLNFTLMATTLLALVLAGIALVVFDLRSQLRTIEDDLTTQADIMALVSGPALAFEDPKVATENLTQVSDYVAFKREFRQLFGFEVDGVDYAQPAETERPLV